MFPYTITKKSAARPYASIGSCLMLSVLLAGTPLATHASNAVSSAQTLGEKSQEASRQSQSRIESMDDEARERLEDTLHNERQTQLTLAYNRQLQVLLDNQNESIQKLQNAISSVDEMERGMLPLLNDMLSELKAFVAQDQPFLTDERQTRLNNLDTLLTRADQSVAEKYRQLLQAYQVELEYSRQLESYTGLLDAPSDGNHGRQVHFIRIGRMAYYYQTLDGQQSALWQPESEAWEVLDPSYNAELNQAIRIARSQSLPELLDLPLPSVKQEGAQ